MTSLRRALCTLAVLASMTGFAMAEADEDRDPPSRAARLSYILGDVSIQPRGVDDWVAAAMNRPMSTADRLWTDKDSRAELQLGTSAIRMDRETSVTLTNLSDQAVQLQLDQGTLNLRVFHLYPGEIYEVDTPNLAFTILKAGSYRFDVDNAGDTTAVTVWKGEGEATGDGPGQRVRSGERARFSSGRSLQRYFGAAPALDGFDDWARVRDKREEGAVSARYVPRGVIGYSDLDGYGRWRHVSPYGWVWSPYGLAPAWAPYRYGHWAWIEPWGWSWIDDAAWGFAPFHYGRWIYYRSAWCWAPGPYRYRPIYAPALVGWIGGRHWGFSIGFGTGVAWFPLGWGEPYFPWYRGSRHYFQRVNIANTHITNITYITNNYYGRGVRDIRDIRFRYRDHSDAVTAVGTSTLANGEPVRGRYVRVPVDHLRGAPVTTEVPVAPTRRSVLGADSGMRRVAPPPGERPVVTRLSPPERPRRFVERGPDADVPRPAARAEEPGNNRSVERLRQPERPAQEAAGAADPRPEPSRETPRARVRGEQSADVGDVGRPGRVVPRPPVDRAGTGTTADLPRPEFRGNDVPRPRERSGDEVASEAGRSMNVPRPRPRVIDNDTIGAPRPAGRDQARGPETPRPPEAREVEAPPPRPDIGMRRAEPRSTPEERAAEPPRVPRPSPERVIQMRQEAPPPAPPERAFERRSEGPERSVGPRPSPRVSPGTPRDYGSPRSAPEPRSMPPAPRVDRPAPPAHVERPPAPERHAAPPTPRATPRSEGAPQRPAPRGESAPSRPREQGRHEGRARESAAH